MEPNDIIGGDPIINACETLVRHAETQGCEVLEKNYHSPEGEILATVFVFVGSNSGEITALVREHVTQQMGMRSSPRVYDGTRNDATSDGESPPQSGV